MMRRGHHVMRLPVCAFSWILYTSEGTDPSSRVIVRAISHRAVAYGRGCGQ